MDRELLTEKDKQLEILNEVPLQYSNPIVAFKTDGKCQFLGMSVRILCFPLGK